MLGGPIVTESCKAAAPCAIGSVVATPSGRLPCKSILHAVTPRAKADNHLLEPTIQAVLDACVAHGSETSRLHTYGHRACCV
jgi:O-acetyl-ADP-ribose deacetylase (regulator of RNase III)